MKENANFYNRFNKMNQELLRKYFLELNEELSLSKKDTKLLKEDFEKAILYYYNNKKDINQILEILSPKKLGECYKDISNNWYPLDNSAKIYPLSMKSNWMSVYRISYYLKEDVIPEILQIALIFTLKRFPTFRTSIRKGFFWHFIDGIKKRFTVSEDKRIPCSYINVSNTRKTSFKVLYFKNRISVEYFHILTDGYGAVVFITTLLSTYLGLLGHAITPNEIALDINEPSSKEEITDEFISKDKIGKTQSLMESKAVQIDGKLSNVKPAQFIHFDMKINDLKKAAKKYNATITEFMVGLLFITLKNSSSENGNIKIQIPVNMRKYYPSKTVRNFSLYIVISINRNNISSLEEVIKEVQKQMKEMNNIKYLNGILIYSTRLVNSLRLIPLFIKKPIASVIYGFAGDRAMTTVISNLGVINIPESMKKYVDKMDFSLGTGITNRALFSMITVNDTVTLSITKYTNNTSVENILYSNLKENNIEIKVHGSEQYENRK